MSPFLLLNERIRPRNRRESCYYSTLGPEWDIERALEASASAVSLLGLGSAHLLGAGGILPVIAKSPVPIEASSLIKSAGTEVPGGAMHDRVGGAAAEELR